MKKRLGAAALALFCAGALAEEAWEEPNWQPAANGVGGASAGSFRLEESDPAGGCAEHDFSVYRTAGSVDMPELSYCARSLKYRMRGRSPEFLISGVRIGSAIGGPSAWVFEDVLVTYRSGNWTETVIMAIHGAEKAN